MKKNICPTCSGTKSDRRPYKFKKDGDKEIEVVECFDKFHFSKGDTFRCRRLKCKNTVTGKETLCDNCKKKDKARKRKIKRNARAIGIKVQRRKKTQWKDKADSTAYNRESIPTVFAKRNKRGDILLKHSPRSRWIKVSVQKFRATEKKSSIVWNPEEKKVVSSL